MNSIRRFLFRMLGVKNYLTVVSRLFFLLYDLRLLKGNPKFDCHYFINKLVKKGDVVIDLGANLGYYSRNFARLVEKSGHVYSVEPVEMYRDVLKKNTGRFSQVTILPYAIGENDGEQIMMGIPDSSKYFSHGRTRILGNEDEKASMKFSATMKRPGSLFEGLHRLDYIKCDIEGYEGIAIPLFEEFIIKHHPILQIEIDQTNRQQLFAYLAGLGYHSFKLDGDRLKSIAFGDGQTHDDLFFIHAEKLSDIPS